MFGMFGPPPTPRGEASTSLSGCLRLCSQGTNGIRNWLFSASHTLTAALRSTTVRNFPFCFEAIRLVEELAEGGTLEKRRNTQTFVYIYKQQHFESCKQTGTVVVVLPTSARHQLAIGEQARIPKGMKFRSVSVNCLEEPVLSLHPSQNNPQRKTSSSRSICSSIINGTPIDFYNDAKSVGITATTLLAKSFSCNERQAHISNAVSLSC